MQEEDDALRWNDRQSNPRANLEARGSQVRISEGSEAYSDYSYYSDEDESSSSSYYDTEEEDANSDTSRENE